TVAHAEPNPTHDCRCVDPRGDFDTIPVDHVKGGRDFLSPPPSQTAFTSSDSRRGPPQSLGSPSAIPAYRPARSERPPRPCDPPKTSRSSKGSPLRTWGWSFRCSGTGTRGGYPRL